MSLVWTFTFENIKKKVNFVDGFIPKLSKNRAWEESGHKLGDLMLKKILNCAKGH